MRIEINPKASPEFRRKVLGSVRSMEMSTARAAGQYVPSPEFQAKLHAAKLASMAQETAKQEAEGGTPPPA
jgi:hypothetical protein